MKQAQLNLDLNNNILNIETVTLTINEDKKESLDKYFDFMEKYPDLYNMGIRESDGLHIDWHTNEINDSLLILKNDKNILLEGKNLETNINIQSNLFSFDLIKTLDFEEIDNLELEIS